MSDCTCKDGGGSHFCVQHPYGPKGPEVVQEQRAPASGRRSYKIDPAVLVAQMPKKNRAGCDCSRFPNRVCDICQGVTVRVNSPVTFQGTTRPDPRLGSTQNVLRDLPEDAAARKATPIASGVLDYFPLAIAYVAQVSKAGNDQHNPGQPLHWARGKSSDHPDCIVRHLIQRGTFDTDGLRHSGKLAWRALALLQEELEAAAGFTPEGT